MNKIDWSGLFIFLTLVCCLLIATGYILGGVYKSTQVIEVKKDFMRPCDICPQEYWHE